jgi:hypothetical protein
MPTTKPKADQVVVSIAALSLVEAAQSLRKCLNSFGLYFPSHWDLDVPCTHQHVPCELEVMHKRESGQTDPLEQDPSGLASAGCDLNLYRFVPSCLGSLCKRKLVLSDDLSLLRPDP